MRNQTTIDALMKLLADNFTLYLKTQNYHWNVTGSNFKSLHDLFEAQYKDLAEANDNIAERVRALGHKIPATLTLFQKDTNIKCGNENSSASEMLSDLSHDQDKIIQSLTDTLKLAEEDNDEATVDFVVGRIAVHEKANWMLKSSI